MNLKLLKWVIHLSTQNQSRQKRKNIERFRLLHFKKILYIHSIKFSNKH